MRQKLHDSATKYPLIKTATFWLKNGKVARMYPKYKTKRLYAKLRGGNYLKVYFLVEYGKRMTNTGKMVMFINEGTYDNPTEAIQALRAFLE